MITPPPSLPFLTVEESYAVCRPVGEYTLDETVDLIDNAIRYCYENEIDGLLADVTGVTGFPSPSVTDRFWFVTKWAETSAGHVVVALVARPELISPDKIGITFAMNRGLESDVFTDKAEALQWLRSALPVLL